MLQGICINHYALLNNFQIGLKLEQLRRIKIRSELEQYPYLRPLNVLIGLNASGKSSFFEALQFAATSLAEDVQSAANKSKQGSYTDLIFERNPEEHEIEFDFLFARDRNIWIRYYLRIAADQHRRPFLKEETVERYELKNSAISGSTLLQMREGRGKIFLNNETRLFNLTEKKISAVNILGHQESYPEFVWLYNQIIRSYFADFQKIPRNIRSSHTGGHKHLNRVFSNIENVLYYLRTTRPEEYRALENRLNHALKSHNKINLQNLDRLDNEGQIKLLICYLILSDPRPVIAFDNPDLGLYYDMAESLVSEFRDYVIRNPNSQIFLATHNLNMLDGFAPEEVWSFDRSVNAAGEDAIKTRFIGADPIVQAMYREGVGLGSLWYSGYLDE